MPRRLELIKYAYFEYLKQIRTIAVKHTPINKMYLRRNDNSADIGR